MNIPILFEDDDLLVINKPPGLVVNRAKTVRGETLQDWFDDYLGRSGVNSQLLDWKDLVPANFNDEWGTPEEIFKSRSGLVHRLDKYTSGALVLAKNPGSLVNLLAQFKERLVEKKYTCLVHGFFEAKQGIITAPLGRSPKDVRKFAVRMDGRAAETLYKVVQEYSVEILLEKLINKVESQNFKKLEKYQGFSLLECWPKTGRTHQIRVHLAHFKHPLVGDTKYVGKKRSKLDSLWCPRQFLHASQLSFTHPRSGERLSVEAKLWGDLEEVLDLLC